MSKIINTSTIGPTVLRGSDNPVTVTATGKGTTTGARHSGLSGASGVAWIITGAGTIASFGCFGTSLRRVGTVSNWLSSGSSVLFSHSIAGSRFRIFGGISADQLSRSNWVAAKADPVRISLRHALRFK